MGISIAVVSVRSTQVLLFPLAGAFGLVQRNTYHRWHVHVPLQWSSIDLTVVVPRGRLSDGAGPALLIGGAICTVR